jgi:demethylmenaquinone methyltransferase/2-methoxy-6-polyprenyl-1,4-benzoquinol methylase
MSRSEPKRWREALPSASWPKRRRSLKDLFEAIAPTYDRLNHLLSLGLDQRWRARTAEEAVRPDESGTVLDLASGTGDLAVSVARRAPRARIVRLDLSASLLRIAERKLAGASSAPPIVAEMERLPLRPGSCVAVTMGYALRHVESLDGLMTACAEVLRPGGRVAFVDMALPEGGLWGRLYRFYFRSCLPRVASLFGGDRHAYDLMVRSVETFPGWDEVEAAARRAGFRQAGSLRLTKGAARVFLARRS